MKITLIVPMYNERENLDALQRACVDALESLGHAWELIYVDDGSTDGTAEQLPLLAEQGTRRNGDVRFLLQPQNRGKTAALAAGFEAAQGDYVFTIDADLQENPAEMGRLLDELEAGADMVVAWRQDRQDAKSKVLASKIFNALVGWIGGLPLRDMNCGFKGMKRGVMESLRPWLFRDMHRYLPILAYRRGYRVVEVPISHAPRRHGKSRYGAERYRRASLDLLLLLPYFRRGRLLIGLMPVLGVLWLCFGIIWLGIPLLVLHAIYLIWLIVMRET